MIISRVKLLEGYRPVNEQRKAAIDLCTTDLWGKQMRETGWEGPGKTSRKFCA